MGKPPISTEWTICDSEDEWNAAQATEPGTAVQTPRRRIRRVWWVAIPVTLLALAITGAWVWRMARAGLDQIDAELSASVSRELWAVGQGKPELAAALAAGSQDDVSKTQMVRDYALLSESIAAEPVTGAPPVELTLIDMEIVRLLEGQAAVQVLVDGGDETYRQMRFYGQTSEGWQRIAPEPGLLGEWRRLETETLIFHYFDLDAAAVEEAAPLLDAFVAGIRADFGLSDAAVQHKLEITVAYTTNRFAANGLEHTVAMKSRLNGSRVIIHTALPLPVWMPAAYTDGEAIVQTARLQLADAVIQEVLYHEDEQWRSTMQPWLSLLAALRLWEFWESDSPLAVWKDEIVEMGMNARVNPGEALVHYDAICHTFGVWDLSPMSMSIPLRCESAGRERYLTAIMPETLDLLLTPGTGCCAIEEIEQPSGYVIALTTVLDYIVATYGRERLPELVGVLGEHEGWETLIPAVFGVSAEEFEAGWQGYVAARYR